MFKRNKIENPYIEICICRDVLESIYDECDKYDRYETGGRIIGYYKQDGATLNIDVCGYIGPGPNARRSQTSFYQDGEYQEKVFRKIESENLNIEHIGNWHTHHVNGLDTLSNGDIATYKRIVNHEKQNTDFFYALLVVAKNHVLEDVNRYIIKHFVFKRGESAVYEIPSSQIKIVEATPLSDDNDRFNNANGHSLNESVLNDIRLRDREFIAIMYPNLKPFFSKGSKVLYWKGKLPLIDNTVVEFLVLESVDLNKITYSVTLSGQETDRYRSKQIYLNRTFDSGWKAIYSFERDLNRETFEVFKKNYKSNFERSLD